MLSRQKQLPDPAEIAIEPIDRYPEYQAALAELQALEMRLAETEQRRRARARLMGAAPKRSAIERAKDLVAGGRIDPTDPRDDLNATHEETFILRQAISAASARLDEVARELSFRVSQRFKSVHDAALIAALRAIDDLAHALDLAAAVRARLHSQGYQPSSTLLPALAPEGALMLGNSASVGASPAWYFKKALEQRGVL